MPVFNNILASRSTKMRHFAIAKTKRALNELMFIASFDYSLYAEMCLWNSAMARHPILAKKPHHYGSAFAMLEQKAMARSEADKCKSLRRLHWLCQCHDMSHVYLSLRAPQPLFLLLKAQ